MRRIMCTGWGLENVLTVRLKDTRDNSERKFPATHPHIQDFCAKRMAMDAMGEHAPDSKAIQQMYNELWDWKPDA